MGRFFGTLKDTVPLETDYLRKYKLHVDTEAAKPQKFPSSSFNAVTGNLGTGPLARP
jgi:hypothetical protein